MERTLVILKPDTVQRGLVGEILRRFEQKGLQLAGLKMCTISEKTAREHYAAHNGQPFFEPLIRFITSGPSVLMAMEGVSAVKVVRTMIGSTFGPDAAPGTIRGDLGMSKRFNLVHASDSVESARRELALFFEEGETVAYGLLMRQWIYDVTGPEPI